MRTSAAVRVSGAWWLWALTAAVGYLFVTGSVPAESRYPLAAQVVAYQSMFLVAPLVSLTAAVTASKFRHADIDLRPRSRSHLAVRLDRLWPVVASAILGLSGTMILAGHTAGALSWPNWKLATVAVATLVFVAAFGDLAGSRLPLKAAGPVAVAVPYLLVAFPPSMNPLWLRHLFGVNSTCCFVWDTVATSVLTATCLTAAAGTIVCLALGAWPSSAPTKALARVVGAGAVALVLVMTAVAAVDGRDWSAGQPRPGAPRCSNGPLQICTWPEHAQAKDGLAGMVARTVATSHQLGVPVPTRIVEQNSAGLAWPTTAADFNVQHSASILNRQFFSALAPYMTADCTRRLGDQGAGEQALPYIVGQYMIATWWQHAMTGQANLDDAQAPTPQAAATLRALLKEPVGEQAAVIGGLVRTMGACQRVQLQAAGT